MAPRRKPLNVIGHRDVHGSYRVQSMRWLGSLLVVLLVGPLVLLLVLWQGWLFVAVLLLQAAGLVAIDAVETPGAGRAVAIRSWLLFLAVLVGTSWIYWRMGGAEPALFAGVSIGWALMAVPWLLSRKATTDASTEQGDAR